MSQFFVTEAENEYVIRGNAAVMKCKIPSFVADFVFVDAWISNTNEVFTRSDAQTDYGKSVVFLIHPNPLPSQFPTGNGSMPVLQSSFPIFDAVVE